MPLNCLATPSIQAKILEMSDIIGGNNFAISNSTGIVTVSLLGLSSSTNYSVQCLTMRPHNIAMPMSVSRTHLTFVVTKCCADVFVTIIQSLTPLTSQQLALRVTLNEQPRDTFAIKFSSSTGCIVHPAADLVILPSSSHSFSQLRTLVGNNHSCSSAFCPYTCQFYAALEGFYIYN